MRLLLLLLASLVREGRSFSTIGIRRNDDVSRINRDPATTTTTTAATSTIQQQFPSFNVSVPQLPPWTRENYLRIHQTVSRRRSFRRLLEIGSILSGRVLRPLVCNLVKGRPRLLSSDDWDAFWSSRPSSKPLSNAQRVAQGLPALGPTFVKLGQALATRPDVVNVPLADALANLQDNMSPFDNLTAKRIIRRDIDALVKRNVREAVEGSSSQKEDNKNRYLTTASERRSFLDSLSNEPVAAASIAQVYKGHLPGYGPVAVKVQRPGIRRKVESDATLFHSAATWLENFKWPRGTPLHGEPVFGSTQFVKMVDEFTARVFEDLDFRREVQNMQLFKDLYGNHRKHHNHDHHSHHHHHHPLSASTRSIHVVVPEHIPELCSSRVIVMEWIEGTKLTDVDVLDDTDVINGSRDDRHEKLVQENLAIVKTAIECTLSQLMEDGIMHGDPHAANLLKVKSADKKGQAQLGYLDFGVVTSVPPRFRDGIVCAVVQLVFGRNLDAIADLCVDLELLPREKLADPVDRQKFLNDLRKVLDRMLEWPKDEKGRSTAVPKLRPFSDGLASLSTLIARYEFSVPPYFLNNARALATLEGIGLKLDPDFNILRVIYPYAINQLMTNPNVSRKTEQTFLEICRSPDNQLIELQKVKALLNDWSILTGYPKRKICWDLATSEGGRRVSRAIFKDFFRKRYRNARAWYLRKRFRRTV